MADVYGKQIVISVRHKWGIEITKNMQQIKLKICNLSKLSLGAIIRSDDFYIASNFLSNILFKKSDLCLHVYIWNKSDSEIQIERTLALFDVNNEKLHEENYRTIYTIGKGQKEDVIGMVENIRSYNSLPRDMLIIDLCVGIKETPTTKSICDTEPENKLRKDFRMMLENPANSDVTLLVGNESISAHWLILCARSAYFKKMFDSDMMERGQNSITIADLSLHTLKMLLEFLYTADFGKTDDLQELFELYYAADKYEVIDLRALCARKILKKATVENACQILQLAHTHSDIGFKMEVMGFIHSNLEAVLDTDGWKKFKTSEPLAADIFSFCLKKK